MNTSQREPAPSAAAQQHPVAVVAAEGKPVTETLGGTGTFSDNNTVYRIPLVHT
ncbi:hypothetical protein [Nocardia niigatensis]